MTWAVLLVGALCAFTPENQADVGGPMRLRNEFPFQNIFLSTPPLDARIPRRRRLDVTVGSFSCVAFPNNTMATTAGQAVTGAGRPTGLNWATLLAESANRPGQAFYLVDTEVFKAEFTWTQPIGRRAAFEGTVPFYSYSSGVLREAVKMWHHAFSMQDTGQMYFPVSNSQAGFVYNGSGYTLNGQRGPSLGDVTLRGLYNVTPAKGWVPWLSVSAALKVPTGRVRNVFGSGMWDGAFGLHATQQFGQWWLYGTTAVNLHSGWRGLPSSLVRDSVDGHLGFEYRVSPEWSVVGALSVYGTPLRLREAQSMQNPATCYGLGARFNDRRHFELEWGFQDNIVRSNNAYDFGIYGRVRFWP